MWPIGQVVKTAASHAVNIGSNPVWVTNFLLDKEDSVLYNTEARFSDAKYIVGVDWGVGPPVPIPNTEVKHTFADNTCRVTGREDR